MFGQISSFAQLFCMFVTRNVFVLTLQQGGDKIDFTSHNDSNMSNRLASLEKELREMKSELKKIPPRMLK